MSQRRLLVAIVDDEEPVRKALRRLFLASGINVETFASGYEFLESIDTQRPDCVVLDLHLPGMTGLEVLEQLAKLDAHLPTVAVTGHDQAGFAERVLAAGAFVYLEKPLDEETLLGAVTSAVRQAEQARASRKRPTKGSGT